MLGSGRGLSGGGGAGRASAITRGKRDVTRDNRYHKAYAKEIDYNL